ncbi:MAG: protein involved in post-translational modification of quorum-sensing peptide [Eubacterium sp.]|jgi:accessory gene regulator B|nr:protein involved in post-translational modification of quorum-sensing peptide [Eubacterium sp.]
MEITFYRKIADKVADAVIGSQQYSEAEAKKIRYGLVCFFSDLYKFILLLIIFSVFSQTLEFLLVFACTLLLRPFIGGFHAKNEVVCIFISFVTMLTGITVGRLDILHPNVKIALIILLPIFGAVISPVRKNKEARNYNVLKISVLLITAVLLILDYYILPYQFVFITVILIYLQAVYSLVRK